MIDGNVHLIIKPLTFDPDLIYSIAKVLHAEFRRFRPNQTIQERVDRLTENAKSNSPFNTTFVLQDIQQSDNWIGTISLVRNSLAYRNYNPWISSLYVKPEYRGNRLGILLLSHAESYAEIHGIKKVWLFTDLAVRLYESCGWKVQRLIEVNGISVSVMCKRLDGMAECEMLNGSQL